MRILRITLLGLLALGFLGVQSSASAALITGVNIEDVSSEFASDRTADQTIDQSGLTGAGAFGVGEHTQTDPGNTMWLTQNTTTGVVTYDLGAVYDLDGIHVWNYNERVGAAQFLTSRGAQSVEILVSETGTGSLTSLGNFTFLQADGQPTYTGAPVDVIADNVRFIRFNILTNYGDGGFVGLSEVQFNEAIPEPTSLALVGLGMLGLFGYRRRQK